MSLGWLTESSLMPKRAKEIEQVGKSTMVDLRAQLYRSEESLKHTESGASAAAALAAERRKVERRRDVLGAGRNAGVGERSASDVKAERDAAALSHEAMARKVRAYEAMARGECEEGRESLIDFELKQLRGDPVEPAEPPTLVSADMAREAERKEWEVTQTPNPNPDPTPNPNPSANPNPYPYPYPYPYRRRRRRWRPAAVLRAAASP